MVTRKDVWRCQMLQSKSLMGTVSQTSAGYSLVCTDPFLMLGESLKCKFLPLCGQREPRKLWRKSHPYPTVIPHTYCLISKHKHFQVVQSFWGQLLGQHEYLLFCWCALRGQSSHHSPTTYKGQCPAELSASSCRMLCQPFPCVLAL